MDMQRSRENGKPIPGWQAGRFPITTGLLLVAQEFRARLKRYSLTARMHSTEGGFKAPPELWDCQLQRMTPELWVLSGFETSNDIFPVDYAQTWVLCPARNLAPHEAVVGMGIIT